MKKIRSAGQTFLNMLREIFDEAAYRRFLERTGAVSSRKAYSEFLREGETRQSRRVKCC